MRRTLPLVIFVALILGALAIRAWFLPDRQAAAPRETVVANTALNADGTPANPPAQNTQAGAPTPFAAVVPPKPKDVLPPLPEIQIGTHVAHAVPREPPPPPPPNLHLPPVPHLNSGYGFRTGSSTGGFSGSPSQIASNQFSGQAQVTGATTLLVGSKAVQLFGIRSPGSDERCGAYHCSNVALVALKGRLTRNPTVFCRTATTGGGTTAAICLDSSGADLGGYLVGEGLAHADAIESHDYVGAEIIARDLRRGLWKR